MSKALRHWLDARARARKRSEMRGYRRLKDSGRLGAVQAAREELSVTGLGPGDGLAARWLGLRESTLELSVRQTLLLRLGTAALIPALLRGSASAGGRVVCPLPRSWRAVLRRHGFPVAEGRCALLFAAYVLVHWANGVRTFARQLLEPLAATSKDQGERVLPHAYFDALSPGCFPAGQAVDSLHEGVVGWYAGWTGRSPAVQRALHSVRAAGSREIGGLDVRYTPSPLPPLGGPANVLAHVSSAACFVLVSLIQLLVGRWQPAIGLAETLRARQAARVPASLLAREYLFHNSSWFKRPLWSHIAQARGSRVVFYFYSTNCEKIWLGGGEPSLPFGWAAIDWPLVLAWDDYQADFVRRAAGGRAEVQVTGPIEFVAYAPAALKLPESAIAVFDVQPHRRALYTAFALEHEYYVPEVAVPFIQDIARATAEEKCAALFKRKRDIGRNAHPAYLRAVERLANAAYWREVPPETSPQDLIRASRAVVSMPYTSTALLGRWLGKPSVYYDPTGLCRKGDPAAHGIEVIRSPEELRNWIASVVGERQAECCS